MRNIRMMKSVAVASVFLIIVLVFLVRGRAQAADPDENGRIAFVGNQSGNFQLYAMDPDGSHMVQITNLAATTFETWLPDFSPDGKRITFCYGALDANGNGTVEIYVVNADGTNVVQLTNDGLFDCAPRWSPDGANIIFGRTSTRTGRLVVSTMRADGSNIKELTTDLWSVLRSGYTPDGRQIVWETQQAGFESVLWIMNADGSHQQRLTQAPLKAGWPSAPSNDTVVFMSNQNTSLVLPNQIYSAKLDGSNTEPLTQPVGDSHDVLPNFSPSKRKIVFASDRLASDGSLDIFTMNADGSSLQRIASGVTVGGCADKNCVSPAWGRAQR